MDSRDIKESLFALVLVTAGNLITGFVLSSSSTLISILPALILLVPPSIGLRGNIYASLSSRINSYLHTGRIEPKFELTTEYSENLVSSTFLLLSFSIITGFLASILASSMNLSVFGGESLSFVNLSFDLVTISILAGIVSAFFMIPVSFFISLGSFRYGWNPDNISAPFITLFGDMITLPILFASAKIVISLSLTVRIFIFSILFILTVIMGFITFYEKRGKKHLIAKRIIKESFLVLLLCVVLDIIAGAVIGAKIESFIAVAGLLTVIPSFLEDGGAIGGVLSSRFGSLLHLGILQPKIKPPKEILKIFGIFHLMGLFIFALIALLAQGMNILMGIETIPTVKLVAVTVLAGQILLVPLNFMAYYFSIVSFRRGIDPDNVGIPLITSMMDVFGTVCFLLALILFGIV